MNIIYAIGFVRERRLANPRRVKSYRLLMRRSALLWRHAQRHKEYETAFHALHTAIEYRELAKAIGGGK